MSVVQAEEIRKARHSAPFRPFTIHLADGRVFRVPHPEFVWVNSSGRSIVLDEPDGIEIIDGMLVTSLKIHDPEGGD